MITLSANLITYYLVFKRLLRYICEVHSIAAGIKLLLASSYTLHQLLFYSSKLFYNRVGLVIPLIAQGDSLEYLKLLEPLHFKMSREFASADLIPSYGSKSE